MFENYFKTAWRNLCKHKAYSIINVLGLTLGIASCLIILLVVQYELNYDRFNSKADRTYRVTLNAIDFNPCVSFALAKPLRNDFPELEAVSQCWFRENGLIKIGNTKYDDKKILIADEYFTSVFDYTWLEGNVKTALKEPNSVVLTESYARKYFGNQEAMGQIVNYDNQYTLKVTGIIKDLPGNTNLPFNMMISFETVRESIKGMMSAFYAIPGGGFTYIVTPKNFPIAKIQSRIAGFITKNWDTSLAKEARLPLQPLTDIHFDSRYLNNTISYTTSRETYYVLSAVAVLIIIIACINFINLATAQAIRRAKEVGVRKILGSSRSQLVRQFLGETTLLVLVALISGLLFVAISVPQLSAWLGLKLTTSKLFQPSVLIAIIASTGIVILLAGLYPAFVQSAFRPVESLKSKASLGFKGLALRKSLVVVQFSISQIMIIGTLVVAYQMDFFENRNLGFNKEAVVSIGIPDSKKNDVLQQQLINNPGVKELSLSSGAPPISNFFTPLRSPENGMTKDDVCEMKFIDEKYMDMFQMKLLAGQKISKTNTNPNDTVYSAVVNEALISKIGIHDAQKAIGKHIFLNGNWATTIIGVVQDFQSESKHKKIRPCAMIYRPDIFFMASVKIQSAAMTKTISGIEESWTALFPDNLFSYEFLDEHIANWYRQEQKEYTAFKLFAGIAILIGCLGLYGLVAFAAAQRIKEVGIRKILGASLGDILLLFSKEFVLLIAIAFLIAAPVAYFIMHSWLQGFAYQVNINAGIFIIAIAVSFIIAALTISYQALKAGVANPVKSLRTE
ncbi:MAG: ABC transporter permease [Chitinophagaceae bacterium]|nr:ABC transporter permease [Chitinophagaceae bacterium]